MPDANHNDHHLPSDVQPLEIPTCTPGIGDVILAPDSPKLIAGVAVEPFPLWPDDRGYFFEMARFGQGQMAGFPAPTTQISATLSYPGTIKAFHYHQHQTDLWVPVTGMLQVALVDLRRDSKTFGAKNTFYIGNLRPWRILIPPGVGHGYKALGTDPIVLLYAVDRFYNPADEGRIPYNHNSIGYSWETQHK